MQFNCPECSFTTEWSEGDLISRGQPVCPDDDNEMELNEEKHICDPQQYKCEVCGKQGMN